MARGRRRRAPVDAPEEPVVSSEPAEAVELAAEPQPIEEQAKRAEPVTSAFVANGKALYIGGRHYPAGKRVRPQNVGGAEAFARLLARGILME